MLELNGGMQGKARAPRPHNYMCAAGFGMHQFGVMLPRRADQHSAHCRYHMHSASIPPWFFLLDFYTSALIMAYYPITALTSGGKVTLLASPWEISVSLFPTGPCILTTRLPLFPSRLKTSVVGSLLVLPISLASIFPK